MDAYPDMYNKWNAVAADRYSVTSFCKAGADGQDHPGFKLEWTPPHHGGASTIRGFEVRLEGMGDYRCSIVLLKHNLTRAGIDRTKFKGEFLNLRHGMNYAVVIHSLPNSEDKYNRTIHVTSQMCEEKLATSATWTPANLQLVYNSTTQDLVIAFDLPPEEYKFHAFDVVILQNHTAVIEETMTKNVWIIHNLKPGLYDVWVQPQNRGRYESDKCTCKSRRGLCVGCTQLRTTLEAEPLPSTTNHTAATGASQRARSRLTKVLGAILGSTLLVLLVAGAICAGIKRRTRMKAADAEQTAADTQVCNEDANCRLLCEPPRPVTLGMVPLAITATHRCRIISSSNSDRDSGLKSGDGSYRLTSSSEEALWVPLPETSTHSPNNRYRCVKTLTHVVNVPDNAQQPSSSCDSGVAAETRSDRAVYLPHQGAYVAGTNVGDSEVFYSEDVTRTLPDHMRCPDDVSFFAPSEDNIDLDTADNATAQGNPAHCCHLPQHDNYNTHGQTVQGCAENCVKTKTCLQCNPSHRYSKPNGNFHTGLPAKSSVAAKSSQNCSMSSIMDKMAAINQRCQAFMERAGNEGEVYSVGNANV